MDTLTFLATVLPSKGKYCVVELSSRKKEHVFVDTLRELTPHLNRFHAAKYNTYFALASFIDAESRTAKNAHAMRSVFLDIDCGVGKAYRTKRDAAQALEEFLGETNLGSPWVVSSGGGLHVYWPFTEDVPIPQWRAVAENFKRLCKQYNFRIDYTVPADAARVLRLPGSLNYKTDPPRPVKILVEGARFEFESFAAAVRGPLNGHALEDDHPLLSDAIPGERLSAAAQSGVSFSLINLSLPKTSFNKIVQRSKAGDGCAQLVYYKKHATQDGMEPLWYALMSVAAKCEERDEATKWLTKLHPYSEERMHQKLKQIDKLTGPRTCEKIDSENPGVCPTCKYWQRITTPAALGWELDVDNAPREIRTEKIIVSRAPPPTGFCYDASGAIFREVKDSDGAINGRIPILPYGLHAVHLLSAKEEHYVRFIAVGKDRQQDILLPQKAVVSKETTTQTLAAQNVIAMLGAGNDKHLFDYVRACVENISSQEKPLVVPDSYGWQENGSFVVGGTVFSPDGREESFPMPGLENVTHATLCHGTLDNWKKFPTMLAGKRLYDLLAIGCGVGFGSPLMQFSGLDGLVIAAGSTRSGTGKTLALQLASTIWGHPRDYKIGISSSVIAMQHRAGVLKSLPLIVDETTNKARQNDMEWFPTFVFDICEGRGKERMESQENKERINNTVWSLLTLVSGNAHMLDIMLAARRHSSEGEIRRMLEWTLNDVLTWNEAEVELIKAMRENHGLAGRKYAAWLVVNRDKAIRVFQEVYVLLRDRFEFTNDERFWHAGIASCIAGCILAGPKYSDVIELPIKEITASFKSVVETMRDNVGQSARTAEDVLNAYTKENYGRFINVRTIEGTVLATLGHDGVVDESLTRTEVMGRVERGATPGMVDMYVEERLLRAHCASMSFGYTDFKRELARKYRTATMRKDMLAKTKGPPMRVQALWISRPELTDEDTAIPVGPFAS